MGAIGGWNGGYLNYNYLYTHSHNTWQTKTVMIQAVAGGGYSSLTHDLALVTGGLITETSTYYSTSQRFMLSANVWYPMASLIEGRFMPFSGSLGSSRALVAGGTIYPRSDVASWRDYTEEFSMISNIWMLRKSMPYKSYPCSSFSADSDSSFGWCQNPTLALNQHLKYFSGHVDNPSFLVQVLD